MLRQTAGVALTARNVQSEMEYLLLQGAVSTQSRNKAMANKDKLRK